MKEYVFRQSNPAVVGVEVEIGTLKVDMPLMKEGRQITNARSIQLEKESISSAEAGSQVAVSFDRVMVGRQINGGDVLYSAIPEEEFRKLKELRKYLGPGEVELLKEIAVMMRKDNPMWGI